MSKSRLTPVLLFLCLVFSNAGMAWGKININLSQSGQALMPIIISPEASPAEKYAASELQKYLNQITGATFTVTENIPETGNAIYVGLSESVLGRCPDFKFSKLGTEGILIRTVDGDLVLSGGYPRGTVYAVYTFLQNELGCRWYAPDQELVPTQADLSIGKIDMAYVPPFIYREYYSEGATDKAFAAKMRLNGREFLKDIPEEMGGGIRMGSAHTLTNVFVKPDEHFEAHPEWFAWRKDEQKRVDKQLCKTNKALQQQVLKEVRAYLEENYATMSEGHKMVSVSCPDNNVYCQCETCLASIEREQTPAGPLIELLNVVARGIDKQYPDVAVNTLAYWHTDLPPQHLKVADNTVVQIGTLDRNHRLPVAQTRFHKIIQGWKKSAKHLYIWDYDANFRNFMQPHPNHFVVGQSLKYYHQNGVKGVFLQGSWGPAAELYAMRTWVYGQLLWDPTLDDKKLMIEFCKNYYGEGGKYILRYIDHINEAVNRKKAFFLGAYNHSTHKWLTLEDMNTATKLIDAAAKAVENDPVLSRRIKIARLSLELVWMHRYDELRATAEESGTAFLGPADPYVEMDRLEENEFNISVYREWQPYSKYLKQLRDQFPEPSSRRPADLDEIDAWQYKEYQEDTFALNQLEGEVINDDEAAGGKALRISDVAWGGYVSFHTPENIAGKWRVLVSLRAQPDAGVSSVDIPVCLYFRPYPGKRLKETARAYANFNQDNSKKYQYVDLGIVELAFGTEIQIQPMGVGHFGKASDVYIDRVVLIRG